MGLDHNKELLSGRRSSRLVPVVSDLVSDLEVLVVSAVGLTGPNLRRGKLGSSRLVLRYYYSGSHRWLISPDP